MDLLVHYMEVELELRQSMISFYEGFPLRWKDQGFQAGTCVIFPNGAALPGGAGGQDRSPWRLDDRDPALPDFPSDDIHSHVLHMVSTALLQYLLFPLRRLFLAHSPGRGGLKRRGKISLVYSQERKKLVKQIISIFIAARFYVRRSACSTHVSMQYSWILGFSSALLK